VLSFIKVLIILLQLVIADLDVRVFFMGSCVSPSRVLYVLVGIIGVAELFFALAPTWLKHLDGNFIS